MVDATPPARQRNAERAALQRRATQILADDRRRQRKSVPTAPSIAVPEPPSKWIKLADLKRALRERREQNDA